MGSELSIFWSREGGREGSRVDRIATLEVALSAAEFSGEGRERRITKRQPEGKRK